MVVAAHVTLAPFPGGSGADRCQIIPRVYFALIPPAPFSHWAKGEKSFFGVGLRGSAAQTYTDLAAPPPQILGRGLGGGAKNSHS